MLKQLLSLVLVMSDSLGLSQKSDHSGVLPCNESDYSFFKSPHNGTMLTMEVITDTVARALKHFTSLKEKAADEELSTAEKYENRKEVVNLLNGIYTLRTESGEKFTPEISECETFFEQDNHLKLSFIESAKELVEHNSEGIYPYKRKLDDNGNLASYFKVLVDPAKVTEESLSCSGKESTPTQSCKLLDNTICVAFKPKEPLAYCNDEEVLAPAHQGL